MPTLEVLQRTLLQHGIESKLIPKESKSYPKPVLKITRIKNLKKLDILINDNSRLPHEMLKKWAEFREVIWHIESRLHYTTKGFDKIVEIKEGWNGSN